jgi:hypothetical protein
MKTPTLFLTIFTSFVFCLLCPSASIDAAQVYAVLVGDSHQSTAFYDMENNLDMMQREAKRIAACNYLPLRVAVFEGFEARSENLLHYLEEMNVDSDDIVLFYASVHGTRSKNKSNRWPDLGFTLDEIFNPTKMTIDFNTIHDLLKAKNPLFLLSIADSCNSIHDFNRTREFEEGSEGFFDEEDDIEIDDEEEVLFEKESIFNHLNPQGPTIEYQMSANDPAPIFNRMIEESEFFKAYHFLFKQPGNVIVSSSSPGEESFGGFIRLLHSFYKSSMKVPTMFHCTN